jgi:Ca2+-binding EF-hand superfamily protein
MPGELGDACQLTGLCFIPSFSSFSSRSNVLNLFVKYDTDRDGKINQKELEAALEVASTHKHTNTNTHKYTLTHTHTHTHTHTQRV